MGIQYKNTLVSWRTKIVQDASEVSQSMLPSAFL